MERYIRSVVWLAGFSGIGYALLVACTPNEQDLAARRKVLPGIEKNLTESRKKKEQLVNVLKSATEANQPFYRLNKQEIEKELHNK